MTTSHTRPRGLVRTPRWATGLVAAAVLLVSTGLSTALAPRSVADTVPPDASLPETVSSDPLPTAQINGVVWAVKIVGSTAYAGGEFTRARPAGAAPGTQEVVRSNLLAFDVTTGVLTSFAPTLNGKVKDIEAAPDGSAIYVSGQFTTVNGSTRNRVAAFSTSNGSLVGGFAPSVNGTVNGLAVTNDAVFIGGAFSAINGTTRLAHGAVNRSNGAIRPYNPSIPNGDVQKLAASPDGTKVVIGGTFNTVNGSSNPGYGLALLNSTTGASLPMTANGVIRNANSTAAILDLAADSGGFYGTGYTFGRNDGNFEGAFKADWNGNLVWMQDCHGDTYGVYPIGDEVYTAGHAHYCGNIAGFPQTRPSWTFQRGIAFSNDVRGTVSKDIYGYFNFEGQPRPALLTWFPDINAGTYTGQTQGPWSVTGNADYVVYGGEFTQVNGLGRQGLVRFARGSIAPHDDGPRLGGSTYVPSGRSYAQGIRIGWPANHDRDNEQLSYALIKNGNVGSPVYTTTRRSTFWQRPYLSYLDSAVTAGQSYSYRVRTTDPKGNVTDSETINVTAGGGPSLTAYDRAALADGPELYWPLNETSGSTATDFAGNNLNGTRAGGVSTGVPGAIPPGTAYRFPGTSPNSVATTSARPGPYIFSTEAWFRTTSTSGGKIIGFGNQSGGASTTYDRHVYLGNSGQVHFGVYPSATRVVSSPGTYRDGQWHHVVATLSPAGQFLYVDGALVASNANNRYSSAYDGYWKVGGDSLGSWPGAGSSGYLNGDIDNVAVYPVALSAAQVSAHYAARTGTPANQAPTASFTTSASDLTVSVNGSGSSDPDGTISTYAWTFGDGGTGSGATTSHTYTAAGTYTVGLTVTDNNGATDSTTRSVTVTAPNPGGPFVADDFNRTQSTGLGTADTGGTWTVSTASGFAVGSGVGQWKLTTPGTTRSAYLGSTLRDSTDYTINLSADKTAVGGTTYLYVQGRRVNSTTEYRSLVRLNTNNTVSVLLEALKGSSTATALTSAVAVPGTLTPGEVIHVRMQTFGTSPTTVRTKVWLGSAGEPSTWTVSVTDSYAQLQAPGAVGLTTYLSGGATNAPVTISVQDLAARTVD